MRFEWKKKGMSAFVVFTLVFTIFSFVPGNAGAVIVEINGLEPSYEKGETITIIAEVLIEDGERIPINNMLLEIGGASIQNASFNTDGSTISVPPWINITILSQFNPDYGYGYGYDYYYYDYGPRYGYDYNFGYGYGYGEGFDFGYGYGYVGLLKYQIEIDSSFLNTGNHSMQLHADTGNIIHQRFSSVVYYFDVGTGGSGPVQNIDTGEYFNDIQSAIGDPDTLNGHTIEVSAGTYSENIIINKQLTLVGEDPLTTTIDGGGSGDTLHVTAHFVNIHGFTITGGGSFAAIDKDAGIELDGVDNCEISSNRIINNDLIGIWHNAANNNNIQNNNISHNMYGVYLEFSYNNVIDLNYIFDNSRGIYHTGPTGNEIINNDFYWNGYAILTSNGNNNLITENEFLMDWFSVYLLSSSGNEINHNDFIDSDVGPYDDGANSWDNGYPSGGNYWSDYTGVDFNSTPAQDVPPSDGIGDTPYTNIGGGAGAQDNYPLMEPWTPPPPPMTYNITLTPGWNLISLPLIQLDESIDSVLSNITGKWDYIQTYDASDPADHWKSNNTFRPDQLNDLKTLDHTVGFWINITEACTLVVSGYESNSTSIPLYAGWNLVGYPTQTPETVGNSLWGTSASIVEVFDAGQPYNLIEVGPTYVMQPGEGYWVHVPADTIWTVDW